MAVLRLTDYAKLSSGTITRSEGEEHSVVFSPPTERFVTDNGFEAPVLFFRVLPRGATRFNLLVGESTQGGPNLDDTSAERSRNLVQTFEAGTGDNDDEQMRTLHQAIAGRRFRSIVGNDIQPTRIQFRILSGRLSLSQIYLMYQMRFDTREE